MKKTILAPAVALSLGLTGALGFAAAPAFASEDQTTDTKETPEASATTSADGGTDANDKTEENADDKDNNDTNENGANDDKNSEEGTENEGSEEGDKGGEESEESTEDGTEGEESEEEAPAEDEESEEEAPAADPALKLSDKKVTSKDFVNKKKGVVATVSGLEPGTKVKFTVTGVSGNAKNVKAYETTATADKDGNAVFSAAGVDKSNPSAYLGKYKVTAEFDDQKLEDSFEVVSGKSSDAGESSDDQTGSDEQAGSGGGSVSGGASDNVSGSTTSGSSGTLPRTGQGLGGLAAGVALLTVGGATVLLTRRTRKA